MFVVSYTFWKSKQSLNKAYTKGKLDIYIWPTFVKQSFWDLDKKVDIFLFL